MAGDGGEALGDDLGEGVEGGPGQGVSRSAGWRHVGVTSRWVEVVRGGGELYHGGSGSEARICCWREAREFVSWERRWRVWSRALRSCAERAAMLRR